MDTTTHTPSHGEALLTFEQQTIRELIVLAHQRLDLQERVVLGEQAIVRQQLATEEAIAQERQEHSRQMAARIDQLVEALSPVLAALLQSLQSSPEQRPVDVSRVRPINDATRSENEPATEESTPAAKKRHVAYG